MINESHGNLLDAHVEALVNPVNTVGVMGKGIALQFRRRYPEMFHAYAAASKRGELHLGRMHIWETDALTGPRLLINFPTKEHWRSRSRIKDIESGLTDLVRVIREHSVDSIAVPPLGCGNGGLAWNRVYPLMKAAFEQLPEVDVRIYPPEGAPTAAEMVTETKRPPMTVGRAALVTLMRRYGAVAIEVSQIEVQKLMYFLQTLGEDLRLDYVKGRYGPYADNLRKVLRAVEGHFTVGFGDGSQRVLEAEPLTLCSGAAEEADEVLKKAPDTRERIERVLRLSEGFESAYGMELLSSVHWVTAHDACAAEDPATAAELVRAWTDRKGRLMGAGHVATAWEHLRAEGWLAQTVLS